MTMIPTTTTTITSAMRRIAMPLRIAMTKVMCPMTRSMTTRMLSTTTTTTMPTSTTCNCSTPQSSSSESTIRDPRGTAPLFRGHLVIPTRVPAIQWPSRAAETYAGTTVRKLIRASRIARVGVVVAEHDVNDGEPKLRLLLAGALSRASVSVPVDLRTEMTSETNTNESVVLDDVVVTNHDVEVITLILAKVAAGRVDDAIAHAEQGSSVGPTALVCVHGTRDERCGIRGTAVLHALRENFNRNDIDVIGVSHVGGHAYAANVIVYPRGDMFGLCSSDTKLAIQAVSASQTTSNVENPLDQDITVAAVLRGTLGDLS